MLYLLSIIYRDVFSARVAEFVQISKGLAFRNDLSLVIRFGARRDLW